MGKGYERGGILYRVDNIVDGSVYFGITVRTLEIRMRQHRISAYTCGSGCYFHRALRLHGWESFVWTVVSVFPTKESLCAGEIEAIREARSQGVSLYNLTDGGEGRFGRGAPLSLEHKKKISESLRGKKRKPLSEDHRQAISRAHRGKNLSEEHRRKLSKPRNLTLEQREKKRQVWAEVSRSEKERSRRRDLRKEYWNGVSKEDRVVQAKLASSRALEVYSSLSEEQRLERNKKISESNKKRWSGLSSEQRSARAIKSWKTRRTKQVLPLPKS